MLSIDYLNLRNAIRKQVDSIINSSSHGEGEMSTSLISNAISNGESFSFINQYFMRMSLVLTQSESCLYNIFDISNSLNNSHCPPIFLNVFDLPSLSWKDRIAVHVMSEKNEHTA